jgi:ABC-type branched-subunit amino acid transport system substrate-binding protein
MSDTIKIGVIADQTGALSIMGAAQANVATLVVDEMNAFGGLLGRGVELIIEDSATDDEQAAAAAAKLVQDDHVDVLLGGIFSSTRQAIKQPAVVEGETLYIYARRPRRGLRWLFADRFACAHASSVASASSRAVHRRSSSRSRTSRASAASASASLRSSTWR